MHTPEEIARLSAEMPNQEEGESMLAYVARYTDWYGRTFAPQLTKHPKGYEVPFSTAHTKQTKEAA